jgi:hypothetical protein
VAQQPAIPYPSCSITAYNRRQPSCPLRPVQSEECHLYHLVDIGGTSPSCLFLYPTLHSWQA